MKSDFSHLNPVDRDAGVIGYAADVRPCPVTGKLTNLYFRRRDGRLVQAFDQAAADDTLEPFSKPALFTFNWVTGGFNSVMACSTEEALEKVAKKFPGYRVDKHTIKILRHAAEIDQYHKDTWTD